MKLKYSEVKTYRQQQLAQQGGCCALCGEQIEDDAVLDHDHKSGLIRQVLHRGCNALLGKIENNMPRNKITTARLKGIAHNLVNYLSIEHTVIRHPTHKTLEERKMYKKKKKPVKPGKKGY